MIVYYTELKLTVVLQTWYASEAVKKNNVILFFLLQIECKVWQLLKFLNSFVSK